jgi:hypothetical protein
LDFAADRLADPRICGTFVVIPADYIGRSHSPGLWAGRRSSSSNGSLPCGASPSSHACAVNASPGSVTPTIRSLCSPCAAYHAWRTIERTRQLSRRRRSTARTPRSASAGRRGGGGAGRAPSSPPDPSLRFVRRAVRRAHQAACRFAGPNRRILNRAGAEVLTELSSTAQA